MKTSMRVAFVTATHTSIFFIALFIFGAFSAELPKLFESSVLSYRLLCGLSLALDYMPALLLSGVLLGFSWAFSALDTKNILRFSPPLMQNFKIVLRISLLCAALCFCIAEVFIPLIKEGKNKMTSEIADFDWYYEMAQNSLDRENFTAAYFYNHTALAIADKDEKHKEKALKFAKTLEISDIRFRSLKAESQSNEEIVCDANQPHVIPVGKTATDLLILARSAFQSGNYFEAHYNAVLASSICGEENPNRKEMIQIASESWNKLEDWRDSNDTESALLFERKHAAFTALINNDVLEAYYSFNDLLHDYPTDPDVKKYAVVSEKKLKEQFFFFEETAFLKHFEVARDVYFTIPRADGGTILLYIRGISIMKGTGRLVQYLRGFNYVTYSKDNKMEMSCRVPFAKMTGESLDSFADTVYLNGLSGDRTIPVILLHSVSKINRDIKSTPVYEYGLNIPKMEYQFLVLPISLSDFNDACHASSGVKRMNLFDLCTFSQKAEDFGFSKSVFGTELGARVSYPFLMLLLFIVAAVFGWNFRLSHREMFKFTWIFVFPLAALIMKLAIEFTQYGLSMIYFILFAKLGIFSLLFVLLFYMVAIFFTSFRFLGMHGENFYEDEELEID